MENKNNNIHSALNHFLQRKWFITALIVGSILNLINQYDAVVIGTSDIHYPKLVLTFLVPYCVASISAWYAKK